MTGLAQVATEGDSRLRA
ncbi:hypothetical protein JL09_g5444 [Pichia kudriavzevii]|uniref:Uncharacterized protein n=1 Tax=Pichia kudriavzevii TaxID=4909 RepID=A0A099NU74_PICKU|nr:hypothetical protein JL09_g5444 [Pichia kudriavzevii]